jgi:hypothetical protein
MSGSLVLAEWSLSDGRVVLEWSNNAEWTVKSCQMVDWHILKGQNSCDKEIMIELLLNLFL